MTPYPPQQAPADPLRFERLPSVLARTGLTKSPLYKAVRLGEFPRPVKLNGRAVAWLSTEVDAWILERARERQ